LDIITKFFHTCYAQETDILYNFCSILWSYHFILIFQLWILKHTLLENILKQQINTENYSGKYEL
jgi:hypothetical protein